MKYSIVLFAALASFSFTSCNDAESNETTTDSTAVSTTTETTPTPMASSYMDLRSGRPVTKDEASGRYVDESGSPVDFYYDASAGDTFYHTGQNVNNSLIHEGDNWRVDDAKIKIDDDQVKIKTDEGKTKIEDDKMKIKTDDQKVKVVDRDKDGSSKTKIKEK